MSNEFRHSNLVGYHIADIHFGCMDSKLLFDELEKTFLYYIVPGIDIIFISGDLFHKILTLNSKHSLYFHKFWIMLVQRCLKMGVRYIRVLKGTLSHDHDQLLNLLPYEDIPDIDIKIITTVSSEIIEDVSMLYLPEEYVEDMDEYYKDFFDQRYDMCIGHGMFKETAFTEHDSEFPMRNSPIFDLNVLSDIVDGPILFGHIHNRVTFKEKLFYSGSYSASSFSDNVAKGFNFFLFRKTDKRYTVKFLENKNSRKYETITIDLSKDTNELIRFITDYKINNNVDVLKVRAFPRDSSENYNFLVINKNFATYNFIIIEKDMRLNSAESQGNDEIITENNDIVNIKDLINNTTDLSEKIVLFQKHYHNEDYDISLINKYLND